MHHPHRQTAMHLKNHSSSRMEKRKRKMRGKSEIW